MTLMNLFPSEIILGRGELFGYVWNVVFTSPSGISVNLPHLI